MTTENNEYKFSLKTIVIVLFAVITLVGGAVYAVVKLSMDDKNSALVLSLTEKEKEIVKQEEIIKKLNSVTINSNLNDPIPSTSQILSSDKESPDIKDLKNKITLLENERNDLLNELIEKSYNNLDPNSELSVLIKELKSDSADLRKNAAIGLFILKDSKSINALINFYFSHNEEARRIEPEFRWIRLIKNMNNESGLDFAIEIMKNEEDYISRWGYDFLLEDMRDKQSMELLIKKLNPIALNHQNSLVRTRAKKLINNYKLYIDGEQELPDNRSLFQVLLDIEKKVNKLEK